jgi:uncharacterized protein (TIGR01777 family)
VAWDPATGEIGSEGLEGVDAAVHLAGVGIGDHRWTKAHKRAVLDSRVRGTTLLAETLAALSTPPGVLASASAVGFYGDRGDEVLTEHSGPGTGFLTEVVEQWEASTKPAEAAGIRVVHLRSGLVLSPAGGALKPQLLPFKLGLGGRIGSGRQWWSWISIADEVGAIRHVIADASLRGPVNVTAPSPVTNGEFAKALGRVLRRPTVVPVPVPALKAVFGSEMVREMFLSGQRVVPERLLQSGYQFHHTDLEGALRDLLERTG